MFLSSCHHETPYSTLTLCCSFSRLYHNLWIFIEILQQLGEEFFHNGFLILKFIMILFSIRNYKRGKLSIHQIKNRPRPAAYLPRWCLVFTKKKILILRINGCRIFKWDYNNHCLVYQIVYQSSSCSLQTKDFKMDRGRSVISLLQLHDENSQV